ncbi:cation:proton antiporter regulatory subunit [Saccharothrix algeriensis]|uniref:Cation:proton antiporter regulatory subunit n=1 Tax=Saccharothrix algeriensis TaxID=173560 RepID=A0A8T8I1X9_9PSEU|nr:cation:proton antiporter regulatory subunit [Saccharothrix algeriensis]MBM7810545.1 TrkA domain protein [Saccharothrix algeriensis]QTR04651.1 cation:proton antiporter regulatory subunit [Saccharothrix algeriensis]
MNVEVTPLPGIGTRQDFMIRAGRRIGVITYRDGKFELIVSRKDDPDDCSASVALTPAEAGTLAGLLGAPQLVAHLDEQHRDVAGISTRQFPIVPGSRFDGRTLGETELRTRTGASIVAVVRAGSVHPSPRPDFPFEGGDLVVVVGTAEGLAKTTDVLDG